MDTEAHGPPGGEGMLPPTQIPAPHDSSYGGCTVMLPSGLFQGWFMSWKCMFDTVMFVLLNIAPVPSVLPPV